MCHPELDSGTRLFPISSSFKKEEVASPRAGGDILLWINVPRI
jgi:hypothetical protein